MTRLVLIGAAGLDWPNLASRPAPRLAALRARGAGLGLRGLEGSTGPAPWASMVTGRPPEAHGVWRRDEAWPGGVRPLTRASWRAPPLWARLAAAGVTTASVAWPGARHGAEWAGCHVDDEFIEASARDRTDWALPRRCAPADVRDVLRGLRVHPTQITGDMLTPLVPGLAEIDQSRDVHLPRLAVAMARAATVQAAAAWLLTERRPDVLFVHHAWLGEVLAGFEARREDVFARVIDGAWMFLDGLVARLADLAGEEALVLVASPGWRGRLGALVAAGPGVTPADVEPTAALAQVAPTILAAFGLTDAALPAPIRGLTPQRALTAAPEVAPAAPAPADRTLVESAAASGYEPPPPPPPAWRAQGFGELALMLLPRDPDAALRVADAAIAADPDFIGGLAVKVMALVALEEPAPLPGLAERLERLAPSRGFGALARAAFHVLSDESEAAAGWLVRAETDTDPEVLSRVAAIWFAAGRPAEAERVFRQLLALFPGMAAAEVGLAMAAAQRRDFRLAEEALGRAIKLDPGRPAAFLQLAQIYARTARRAEAAQAADRAVALGADASQADQARRGRLGA